MSRFTEQAIMRAFFELLQEKTLDKVTVSDIASRCGINRNTFYYHYHDVYDLLESLIASELGKVMDAAGGAKDLTWEAFVEQGTRFLSANRRLVFHIHESSHHEILDRYIDRVAALTVSRYIDQQAQGLEVDPSDRADIVLFGSIAFEGLLLRWVNEGMKTDAAQYVTRLSRLFDGAFRRALERSAADFSSRKDPSA